MVEISEYTTLSVETERAINKLGKAGKLRLAALVLESAIETMPAGCFEINIRIISQLEALNFNQSLGLVKALCDQCQDTLVSK